MIQLLGKIPDKITVAVSGGPDSMAALNFLNNGKRSVTALYFHHGTAHGEVAKRFLRKYCFRSQVHLIEGYLQGQKIPDQSWEEFWRKERYECFRQVPGPIVTAHHLDDVVEWWLLTSMHGESKTIPYENPDYEVIRPFLLTPKSALLEWCDRKHVPFLEDPTNESRDHMRNVIRHDVMPYALKVNPGIHKVVKKKIQQIFDTRQKLAL